MAGGALPFGTRAGVYALEDPPSTGNPALEAYIARELGKLMQIITQGQIPTLQLEPQGVAPGRPSEGMIGVFLAGVVGAGAGVYEYKAGAWVKL